LLKRLLEDPNAPSFMGDSVVELGALRMLSPKFSPKRSYCESKRIGFSLKEESLIPQELSAGVCIWRSGKGDFGFICEPVKKLCFKASAAEMRLDSSGCKS